ncbi:exported hypothetical protein [Vibrio owensii]|uniref:Uncharacterized protein n=1 Tax=Vibrio owensii TaxID=696485 RepID=A0AAU9Q761_9VIBR|nr:exported hypothetical protein [Vibrio owensii]
MKSVLLFLSLFSIPSFAHNLNFMKVDFILGHENSAVMEYRILAKTTLEYMYEVTHGENAHSIDLAQISPEKAKLIVTDFYQLFNQSMLTFDGKIQTSIGGAFGITEITLYEYLKNREHHHGYIEFYSSGVISKKYTTLSINFPESLDNVELFFSRPKNQNTEILIKDVEQSELTWVKGKRELTNLF